MEPAPNAIELLPDAIINSNVEIGFDLNTLENII
jgi:hypothetical protein